MWIRLRTVLVWVGILIVTLFVGLPTALVLWTRSQISSAVREASSVRLEEYSRPAQRILTSKVLTPAEFRHVIDALPLTCVYGFGLTRRCFSPHHRVVIVDRTGSQETILDVCFGCEQFRLSGNGIDVTPGAWRQPLRQLFLKHDIPIRHRYEHDIGPEMELIGVTQ